MVKDVGKMSNRFTAKIIADGRVTIPDTLRELLSLNEGDFVEIEVTKIKKTEEVVAE
jgi:AbrB family looped-hinge helix DNA binding protein